MATQSASPYTGGLPLLQFIIRQARDRVRLRVARASANLFFWSTDTRSRHFCTYHQSQNARIWWRLPTKPGKITIATVHEYYFLQHSSRTINGR
jgi:hypothetical protein